MMERQSGIQSIDRGSRVLSAERIAELNERFQAAKPEVVLQWAIDTFAPKVALASSFGAEDMVLIDMLSKLQPPITIFTLDTGRLHEETYDVMERTRERYKVAIESYFPGRDAVEALERERGFYSFRQSVEERKFCCRVRKVQPLVPVSISWKSMRAMAQSSRLILLPIGPSRRSGRISVNTMSHTTPSMIRDSPASVAHHARGLSSLVKMCGRDVGGGKARQPRSAGCISTADRAITVKAAKARGRS